ncbi:MAG: hypothetical protein VX695_00300, partial [Chloroflexota bacterium]|nr:hypothetical protein [Chloroflexota bacterium]
DNFKGNLSEDTLEKIQTLVERINSLIADNDLFNVKEMSGRDKSRISSVGPKKDNTVNIGTLNIDSTESATTIGSLPVQTQF